MRKALSPGLYSAIPFLAQRLADLFTIRLLSRTYANNRRVFFVSMTIGFDNGKLKQKYTASTRRNQFFLVWIIHTASLFQIHHVSGAKPTCHILIRHRPFTAHNIPGGQFAPAGGGQFLPANGGQFIRFLHISIISTIKVRPNENYALCQFN